MNHTMDRFDYVHFSAPEWNKHRNGQSEVLSKEVMDQRINSMWLEAAD